MVRRRRTPTPCSTASAERGRSDRIRRVASPDAPTAPARGGAGPPGGPPPAGERLFWRRAEVLDRLRDLLDDAFERVVKRVEKDHISHRVAAMAIGVDKVAQAKATRGLFP